MSTYQQLKDLIVAQGIVTASFIHPTAHLTDDLRYDTRDIAELARMAEHSFHIQIGQEEYPAFTDLRAIVHLLNNKQIRRDLTSTFSDYLSLG